MKQQIFNNSLSDKEQQMLTHILSEQVSKNFDICDRTDNVCTYDIATNNVCIIKSVAEKLGIKFPSHIAARF